MRENLCQQRELVGYKKKNSLAWMSFVDHATYAMMVARQWLEAHCNDKNICGIIFPVVFLCSQPAYSSWII